MKFRFFFVLAIVSVLLLALPNPARALDEDLEGLHVISILVESPNKEAEDAQITKQMLEDQVLVTIRSKAPNLRVDPKASPYLYVNLNFLATGSLYAAVLTLQLVRPVEVLIGEDTVGQLPSKRRWTLAAVWDNGTIFTGGRSDLIPHLRSVLDKLLESFLAAYYRSNK